MTKKLKECLISLGNISQMKGIPQEYKEIMSTELICMDFELQNIEIKVNEFYKRYINDINFLVNLKSHMYDILNENLTQDDEDFRILIFDLINRVNKQIRMKENRNEK